MEAFFLLRTQNVTYFLQFVRVISSISCQIKINANDLVILVPIYHFYISKKTASPM
jgi:hypothetical protein